jgi:hypothetical protein
MLEAIPIEQRNEHRGRKHNQQHVLEGFAHA